MIFGMCKLHTTRSGVMQISANFIIINTSNAFMTILSSGVILLITVQKCVVIQQCYFYKKTGRYSQKYYYKLKG